MNEKQLPMMNVLNGGYIFTIFVYWIVPYMILPSLRPFLGNGLWYDLASLGWIDMVACAVNGGALILILKEHLSDNLFDVSIAPKQYIQTTFAAWTFMMVWVLGLILLGGFLFGEMLLAINFVPLTEFTMNMMPIFMLDEHPVLSTLIFTLLTPFAICGMFYASGFAPLASRKTWLGYVNVAFVLLLVVGIKIFWFKQPDVFLAEYLIQLPIHLAACWAYRKTDNLWAAVFSVSLLNLTISLLYFLLTFLSGSSAIAA